MGKDAKDMVDGADFLSFEGFIGGGNGRHSAIDWQRQSTVGFVDVGHGKNGNECKNLVR